MAAEIEELNAENKRLHDEITKLKGITEPGKEYFHRKVPHKVVDGIQDDAHREGAALHPTSRARHTSRRFARR
eukprot:5133114-Pleurochrysis_carterae.AAC.1